VIANTFLAHSLSSSFISSVSSSYGTNKPFHLSARSGVISSLSSIFLAHSIHWSCSRAASCSSFGFSSVSLVSSSPSSIAITLSLITAFNFSVFSYFNTASILANASSNSFRFFSSLTLVNFSLNSSANPLNSLYERSFIIDSVKSSSPTAIFLLPNCTVAHHSPGLFVSQTSSISPVPAFFTPSYDLKFIESPTL